MFLRIAAATLLSIAGFPAAALCNGESYLDRLTEAELAQVRSASAATPYGQGIVWDVNKNNTSITVIGTMHIYDRRLEPIHADIQKVVETADLVMLEATPAEEAQLKNLIATDPDILFLTDGPTLPEVLDEETWDMIVDAARSRMIPPFLAAKMQPWYLSMMLSIPPCAMTDAASGARGLDHMIMADAQAAGVPMQALEPYTTLFDIFDRDTFEHQIDMLRVNLSSPDLQQEMFVAMLDSYFAGDTASLWEMSRIAMAQAPGMDPQAADDVFAQTEQGLLIGRNINWIPHITEAAAKHDNIVVAVGAAHLIGESGILRLLENEGWAITSRD